MCTRFQIIAYGVWPSVYVPYNTMSYHFMFKVDSMIHADSREVCERQTHNCIALFSVSAKCQIQLTVRLAHVAHLFLYYA